MSKNSKEYYLEYYRKNKKKAAAKHKKHYAKNRGNILKYGKEWRENFAKTNPVLFFASTAIGRARARARRQNIPFTITKQDIVDIFPTDLKCPIFGALFVFPTAASESRTASPNSPSLDKIKPELGYVPGNIAIMSYRANVVKNDGSFEEHYKIANWLKKQA